MENVFLTAAIICVFIGIGSSIAIVSYLQEHGVKINWLLIRLFLPKYVSQYKKITEEEKGKPGYWYYIFVSSMCSTLVLAVIGLILKFV